MALLKKSFAPRLLAMPGINNRSLTNCRTSTAAAAFHRPTSAPDTGDDGMFRRFLHRQAATVASNPAGLGFVPTGEKLLEKLRGIDIARERIRLPEVRPPAATEGELTVADAKKILRLSQLEKVKSRLKEMEEDFVTYPEFVEICVGESLSVDQGLEFSKMLDESGTVIVLGNVVFLRPQKVVKTIQGLIPSSLPPSNPNDPRNKELQELEKKKSEIDLTAATSVKRELCCGLVFLVLQTAAFMRLTFWELTWDVMEPICFFVTSMQFIGGYGFFLRTAKEPSFEAFFQNRFSAKQRRLFKAKGFNSERYTELKKVCSSSQS